MEHMKWWGWGKVNVSFTLDDKPGLAPFIKKHIDVDVQSNPTEPVHFEMPDIPEGVLPSALGAELSAAVGADYVSEEPMQRLVHARGKSLRDLIRIRRGDVGRLPDVVVFPGSEDEVLMVVQLALAADAVVIAFGAGSNISGGLEAPQDEQRTVISVDLGRMRRVLSIDAQSRIARVQAGILGPDLEDQLQAQGWTMGHFPDSFTHSSLGGWIATRSSGMQSDKYGDIADLTRAVRVVTPKGMLVTRPVPSTSTGPSVREMVLGSEGRLGIITEATVQVHRVPERRQILAYLFPDWQRALQAMNAIAASEASPTVTRVSDASETQFSFATKKDSNRLDSLKSDALTVYLRRRLHFNLPEMCLSFIGYEGSPKHVDTQRKLVGDIVKSHGGICVGSGPGALYDQKKFDTPYIRDFLLDHGVYADVSETAAPWSRLPGLYEGVSAAANKAFDSLGVRGYLMCHLSHSYHAGACLYFTFAFAFNHAAKGDSLAQYDVVKQAIQQAFLDNGGTLSHHHAVGTEHAQWLEQDISAPGVEMVRALFNGIDPGNNLNPGKIVH